MTRENEVEGGGGPPFIQKLTSTQLTSIQKFHYNHVYRLVSPPGSGAENFDDYALGSKISNGNGAGQLAYSAINAPDISTIGTQKQVAWLRYFNNNGGSPITVYEVGIYTRGTVGNATVYFMLCRDLLSGGVVVADTGQLKVTYTLQLTYPA